MIVLLTTLRPISGHIQLPETTHSFWPGASAYTSQTGRKELPLRPQVPLCLDQQLVNFSWEESESRCCQSSGPCNTCSISQPESSLSWCFQKLVSYFSRTLITETKFRLRGMRLFSLPTLFLKSFLRVHVSVESLPAGLPGVSALRLGNNAGLSYPSLWTLRIGTASLSPYLHYLYKDRKDSLKFLEWMDEFH